MHRIASILALAAAACSQASPPAEATPDSTTAAPPATSPASSRLARWVKQAYPDMGPLMMRSGRFDLDGDGTDETLVYVGGPMLCGTGGCNLVVLKDDGAAYEKIGDISVAQLPVGVLETRTNGMRDLAVTVYGGGIPRAIMKVPFDGASYAGNPTVPPATKMDNLGTEIIAEGELTRLD